MINFQRFGIDITLLRGGKMKCPKCCEGRKHKRDTPLAVDTKTGLFFCHHCGWSGCAADGKEKKQYVKPPERLEKLSARALKFFEEDRKISNNTLLRFNITEATEYMPQLDKEATCICFNYYKDEELVNIKFRGPQKSFKLSKGAELVFYNIDALKDEKTCIIVEGEIDCLTMHEAGFFNCVSVPNGANKGNQKLEYLDNCWEYFEKMEKVILCTDDDSAGIVLRDELARRLGFEKCFVVSYPEGCKDANDVLVRLGVQSVRDMVLNSTEWPLEWICSVESEMPNLNQWFYEGYPKGAKAHIDGFDDLLSFAPGQITTVTGTPGHGKDEFMNYIMANMAKHEGWSIGICGFEESPAETMSKLIEKLMGKSFAFRKDPFHRLTEEQYHEGLVMVDDYFSIIDPEELDNDIDSLLAAASTLVKRRGIKIFYINPWNWIEHTRPTGMSETEYVSQVYTKLIKWSRKYRVHIFLLAHTTKMINGEVPTLYNISGSANFYNKTHNGITVYRDMETGNVDVYVLKCKQSWLGKIGIASFRFDTMTRQYIAI